MAFLESEICCCGASKWLKVFAWIHIILALGVALAIIGDSGKKLDGKAGIIWTSDTELTISIPKSWSSLLDCVGHLFAGAVLLIGTRKEKVELILGWGAFIAILGIHNIVITVNRLYGTVDTTQLLTRTLAYLSVLYFPVYVVLWRVIEINRSRRPNTYSLPV